jgi:hypothetical protein
MPSSSYSTEKYSPYSHSRSCTRILCSTGLSQIVTRKLIIKSNEDIKSAKPNARLDMPKYKLSVVKQCGVFGLYTLLKYVDPVRLQKLVQALGKCIQSENAMLGGIKIEVEKALGGSAIFGQQYIKFPQVMKSYISITSLSYVESNDFDEAFEAFFQFVFALHSLPNILEKCSLRRPLIYFLNV